MGQILLGAIVLTAVIGAFWLTGRLAPRVAVSPEEWVRSRRPSSTLADLVWTLAAVLGTATVFGGALALHRWPEVVLYFVNLGALVALLIFQMAAVEERSVGGLSRSGEQGRLNGFLCTIYGIETLAFGTPTSPIELGLLLFLAVSLAVRLWQERHALPEAASSSA